VFLNTGRLRGQVLSTVDDDHHSLITHPAFVYSMVGD